LDRICEILQKRELLRVHVHKTDDVAALLRLADEFQIRIAVEHGMAIDQLQTFTELKQRNIFITYGPIDAFAYKVELKQCSWRNLYYLLESGVDFGLMTDHPFVRASHLFLQTRWLLRAGCTKSQAIAAVTLQNAKSLGIEKLPTYIIDEKSLDKGMQVKTLSSGFAQLKDATSVSLIIQSSRGISLYIR